MERTVEQRVSVNVCVQLQKSPSETSEMLKAVYVDVGCRIILEFILEK
jgi:hypothetical protein